MSHYQIPGTNVYLLDTPRFDDPNLSDTDILTMISYCLESFFKNQAEIAGALYVHPITEARMKRSAMTNLRMFKKIIGMDKMANVRLVTTKWSLQPKDKLEDHERDLASKKEFWKPLLERGASIARFQDSFESAMDIVRPLVRGQPFMPLLLKERVVDGLRIAETQAGQVVNDKVEEAIEAGKKQIEELKKEWEQAMADREVGWAAELEQEKKKQQAELNKSLAEMKKLHEANSNGGLKNFGQWAARVGAIVAGSVATAVTYGAAYPAALLLYGATHEATSDD